MRLYLHLYAPLVTSFSAIRCWVPSVNGARFGIKFRYAGRIPKRPKFGLEFILYFDGIEVFENYTLPSEIAGDPQHYDAECADKTERYFQFGKLQLTGVYVAHLRKAYTLS